MILLDMTVKAPETFPDFEVTISQRVPPPSISVAPLLPLYLPPYADHAAITFGASSVPENSKAVTRGMQVSDSGGALRHPTRNNSRALNTQDEG